MNILDRIIKEKKKEVAKLKKDVPLGCLIPLLANAPKVRSFKKALKKRKNVSLIAEIKKASPSAGMICENFNPLRIAKIYKKSNADCLSVLTDKKFFKGRLDYIKEIRKQINLPILRKDFIVDEYQIYESRLFGTDAVLLIASILSPAKLKSFLQIAKKLKMDCLVECDCLMSLKKALKAKAVIIGINNRNLRNFKIDIGRSKRLVKFVPKNKIIVSESGIKTKKDIEYLKALGVDAVLIGGTFMKSKNIGAKIKELFG